MEAHQPQTILRIIFGDVYIVSCQVLRLWDCIWAPCYCILPLPFPLRPMTPSRVVEPKPYLSHAYQHLRFLGSFASALTYLTNR